MDLHSQQVLATVIRNTRVAALGTVREDIPQISLVQYVTADDFSAFYIHASRLAQHTVDMQKNKRVGLLIAETDDGRADPQTLVRVSIRGSAEMMQNGEPGYTPIKELYLARFPESEPFFDQEDYNLWRIKPKGGWLIAGIGRAFNITPETLLQVAHISLDFNGDH